MDERSLAFGHAIGEKVRADPRLVDLLGEETSERATRLPQSTPFVGILTHEERAAILSHFEHS